MNLLIDNGTYYSAMSALDSSQVDADSLFHLANLIDAIVLCDKVILAPTLYRAELMHDLFYTDGPCTTFSFDDWSDDDFSRWIATAATSSIQDVVTGSLNSWLSIANSDQSSVIRYLRSVMDLSSREDVLDFYSQSVYLTDQGTKSQLPTINGLRAWEDQSIGEQVGQLLLRTNGCLGLSEHAPYQPHSHRSRLVVAKASLELSKHSLGLELLRSAEGWASGVLAESGASVGFGVRSSEFPMMLNAVMATAGSREDLIDAALDFRRSDAAVTLRRWLGSMEGAAAGSAKAQREASAEYARARQALNDQVAAMVGGRSLMQGLGSTMEWTAAQAELAQMADSFTGGTQWLGRQVGRIGELNRSRRAKRRVSFYTSIARKGWSDKSFEQLVSDIFGRSVSSDELKRFHQLREQQRAAVNSLAALKKSMD